MGLSSLMVMGLTNPSLSILAFLSSLSSEFKLKLTLDADLRLLSLELSDEN